MKDEDFEKLLAQARQKSPIDRKTALDLQRAMDVVFHAAHRYIAPLYFFSERQQLVLEGATATFLDQGSPMLATNQHVLKAFRRLQAEDSSVIAILDKTFIRDLEDRLIDSSEKHDIATFAISREEVDASRRQFPPMLGWPPKNWDEKTVTVVAGYPQDYRQQQGLRVEQGGVSIGEFTLENTAHDRIVIACDKREWVIGSGKRDLMRLENWGGLSGSGVFIHNNNEPLVLLRLAGIITSRVPDPHDTHLLLQAAPVSLIDAEGRIAQE